MSTRIVTARRVPSSSTWRTTRGFDRRDDVRVADLPASAGEKSMVVRVAAASRRSYRPVSSLDVPLPDGSTLTIHLGDPRN